MEEEIVRKLLQFHDVLSREKTHDSLSSSAEAVKAELINLVNNFYYEKLTGLPEIKNYTDKI